MQAAAHQRVGHCAKEGRSQGRRQAQKTSSSHGPKPSHRKSQAGLYQLVAWPPCCTRAYSIGRHPLALISRIVNS